MTTLLRRLFIRDYRNVQSERVRVAHGVLAAWLGLLINVVLVAMKLTLALILASAQQWIFPMALLADAIDNAGDVASNVVNLIGFRAAGKPADEEHPFGHERIEYIAGLIVSVLVAVAGCELIFSSIESIVSGANVSYDWATVAILGVSILLKFLQGYMNLGLAKAISSPSLKATAIDSFADTIVTFSVLLSALLSITLSWGFLDGYFGIVVALFVLASAIKMIKETADPLIGKAFAKEDKDRIVSIAKAHPEILGVHDVLLHQYGPTKTYISLHAEVDESVSLTQAHEIASAIEEEIGQAYHAETTIHVDPVEKREKEGAAKALALLQSVSPDASLHDFRIREMNGTMEIAMDILLPHGEDAKKNALRQCLEQGFPEARLRLKFEHDYAH